MFAQSDGVALPALRKLEDLFRDHLGRGIGTILQTQRAQYLFVCRGEDLDLVWAKGMILQQAINRRPSPSSPSDGPTTQ
jgi:hypothetical protein